MAFRFRLETILKLKRLSESRALQRLAASLYSLRECDDVLDDLRRAHDQACRTLTNEGDDLSAQEFGLVARQLDVLADRIENTRSRKEELDAEVDTRSQAAQDRVTERKGHERIKERARHRFCHWLRRRRRKQMDEVGARARPAVGEQEVESE